MKIFLLLFFACLAFSCQNQKETYQDLYVLPTASTIIIDGNNDDWDRTGLEIPLVADVFGNTDSTGFYSTVKLAWDDQYIYLLAEVHDDVVFQNNEAPLWRNDGMELFLTKKKGTSEILQILIAQPLTDDFPVAQIQTAYFGKTKKEADPGEILISSQITDKGYNTELAVPFSFLNAEPAFGDTLGLNFYIGDSDSKTKHNKFSWHYHDNTYLNHDALYQVVLGEKGTNHHLLSRAFLVDTTQYHFSFYGTIPLDDSIQLVHKGEVLSGNLLKGNTSLLKVEIQFEKSKIKDFSEPLFVYAGDLLLSKIHWLDIPRKYVNIQAPNSFENEILLFEKQDAKNFPPKGATLFVGSSSIRLWRSIPEDFPELNTINRGFGGSQTCDVLHYFDRIVKPYHPGKIVFFAGTNDLASGKPPAEVVANTEEFIKKVHALFPQTEIFILSNTIAVSRKHLHQSYREANRLLQKMLNKYSFAEYIDVTNPGVTPSGVPRPEIYRADSLHLNQTGYAMWKEIVRASLLKE